MLNANTMYDNTNVLLAKVLPEAFRSMLGKSDPSQDGRNYHPLNEIHFTDLLENIPLFCVRFLNMLIPSRIDFFRLE